MCTHQWMFQALGWHSTAIPQRNSANVGGPASLYWVSQLGFESLHCRLPCGTMTYAFCASITACGRWGLGQNAIRGLLWGLDALIPKKNAKPETRAAINFAKAFKPSTPSVYHYKTTDSLRCLHPSHSVNYHRGRCMAFRGNGNKWIEFIPLKTWRALCIYMYLWECQTGYTFV